MTKRFNFWVYVVYFSRKKSYQTYISQEIESSFIIGIICSKHHFVILQKFRFLVNEIYMAKTVDLK
jgi:hypothetical protein